MVLLGFDPISHFKACNILFFSTGLLGASGLVFMMIILVSASDLKRGEIPITMILAMLRKLWFIAFFS